MTEEKAKIGFPPKTTPYEDWCKLIKGYENLLTEKDKQIEELKRNRQAVENARNVLDVEQRNYTKELKAQIDYAKSIIKSLLDNSDEYAEQRARDFIKE